MTAPTRLGLLVALATLLADQASKLALLFGLDLPVRPPIEIGPFVTLTSVWNRGVSYGLFQQSTEWGRFALIAVSVAATLFIGLWLRRTTGRLLPVSLGLIAGGAVGNTIDRLAYGAVFDFVHLHAGSFSWYVFNVADVAIVAGVVGLVIDAVRPQGRDNVVPAQKLPE